MSSLSLANLKKRNNLEILRAKINVGYKFELINSKKLSYNKDSVVISPEPTLLDALKNASKDPDNAAVALQAFMVRNSLQLPTEDGKIVPSSHLIKTRDFGSRHSADIYIQETREFNQLKKALNTITVFGLRPVDLFVTTSTGNLVWFDNVTKVVASTSPRGNPEKADFMLVNDKSQCVCKISHKSGNKARHFMQWSGIKHFADHPEIVDFGEKLKLSLTNKSIYPKTTVFASKLKDKELKKKAMFGFGEMEVDLVIQGKISFVQAQEFFDKNPTYEIVGSSFLLSNKDDIDQVPADYEPILLTKHAAGKASFGIAGCRAMIYPYSGKTIHHFFV